MPRMRGGASPRGASGLRVADVVVLSLDVNIHHIARIFALISLTVLWTIRV